MERNLETAMERLEQLMAQGGVPTNLEPHTLNLRDISIEESLFQPRDNLSYTRDSENHIGNMAAMLRAAPQDQKQLEPIVITSFGTEWFCIDGHHRLKAYVAAGVFGEIPVTCYSPSTEGNLRIKLAMRHAAILNVREKLQMTSDDRANNAWRLCIIGGMTKAQLALASALSQRTVASMRSILTILRSKNDSGVRSHSDDALFQMSWRQAVAKSRDIETKFSGDYEDRIELMAVETAQKLRKHFSLRLDANPEVTARALEIYSGRLPGRLIEEWGPTYRADEEDEESDEK
jgi:hypothetical protein